MFASEVRLAESGMFDSAGMLIAADGSSRQRGHGEAPELYADLTDALFPSGSAALYRRKMLQEIGTFDEDFFLYCEDTDLGLRARWAGWTCRYVPGAVVRHRYSHSAGRASLMKAYFVERNRLCAAVKNFPFSMLVQAPFRRGGALLLASGIDARRQRESCGISRRDRTRHGCPFVVLARACLRVHSLARLLKDTAQDSFFGETLHQGISRISSTRHAITVRKVASL